MKIIGISGATGAGKSTLCAELAKYGAEIIDADEISRAVTGSDGEAFSEIVKVFGNEIVAKDGELDRKALANIVFNDRKKLELLNKITHKHIFERIRSRLNCCKADIAVLDVPLLFGHDFPIHCDLTVAVLAERKTRLERILKRDNITEAEALARMKNQMSDDEYKTAADVWFVNDGDSEKVKAFAKELCKFSMATRGF